MQGNLAVQSGSIARFDPSHIAAGGISSGHGFSGIAIGTGFLNLLTGKSGTKVNTPTNAVRNYMGLSAHFTTSTTDGYSFAGNVTANDLAATIAAVITFDSFSASQGVFASDYSSTNGLLLRVTSAGLLQFVANGVSATSSSITLVAGVPYFIAASCLAASGTVNFIAVRLDTGAVFTSTGAAPASSGASNGTYVVGNSTTLNVGAGAFISAVMFAPKSMSMAALQTWGADPWSFWYQ